MIYVILLLFVCTFLAHKSTNKQYIGITKDDRDITRSSISFSTVSFVILLVIMVCFSGLRTFGNDTANYISTFEERIPNSLSAIKSIDWAIGSNPLFVIYQIIMRSVFSANGYMFVFVSALITIVSMVVFMRKKSINFGFAIYIFIAFGVYAFTFAAIKQCLATAIAIWSVPLFLNKKIIRSILLILVAMFIHPYVIILFAFFFLHKNIWDKRAVVIIAITIIFGFAFSTIIESALNLTSMIGEEYSISRFEGNGINFFRILVYWVTPVLSFAYRKKIREKNDKFLNICVNLSFVSACFVLLAILGAATPLGRMANYLDIFTCIALPAVIQCDFNEAMGKKYLTSFAYVGFFLFYLSYYNKFMPDFFANLFTDYYAHVSITALF